MLRNNAFDRRGKHAVHVFTFQRGAAKQPPQIVREKKNVNGKRNTDTASTWETLLISLLLAVNLWNYS